MISAYNCLFTIPNYWPYAVVSSQSRCSLPGKLFVARASGQPNDQHHFMAPSFWDEVNRYLMVDGRFYVACRVRSPGPPVAGGRFCNVKPSTGPWEVWCNGASDGSVEWTVSVLRDGQWAHESVRVERSDADWTDLQLVIEPQQVILQVDRRERLRASHDPYQVPFHLQVGSQQTQSGGAEVESHFREVFVSELPYPYPGVEFARRT